MPAFSHNPKNLTPKFYSAVGCFVVTLPNLKGEVPMQVDGTSDVANRQHVGLGVGLGAGLERWILDEIRACPQVRMSEIAAKYQVTKRTIERMFSRLTQGGKVVRVGGKRFGHGEVME